MFIFKLSLNLNPLPTQLRQLSMQVIIDMFLLDLHLPNDLLLLFLDLLQLQREFVRDVLFLSLPFVRLHHHTSTTYYLGLCLFCLLDHPLRIFVLLPDSLDHLGELRFR